MILTVTLNPTIDRVYVVEDFKIGNVHRVKDVSRSAGGKGINVARVSKILGRDTAAMGFVGGFTGAFIKSEIENMGIKTLFTDIAGETRTNVNISDGTGKSGEILEPGPEISSDEAERFLKTFAVSLQNYDIICVSGSLPRGLTSEFYRKLIFMAKEKGKKIIVDTSGDTLFDVLSANPFMVKPNKDELKSLLKKEIKTDEDLKEALFFLLDKGVEVPFISLGKGGAVALLDGEVYKLTAPDVTVINAVGSGDSAVAGVASGLDMGYNMIDSLKLSMASGVANTQFRKTGFVTKELVEKYFDQIKVSKI